MIEKLISLVVLGIVSCSLAFAENIEALKKGKRVVTSNNLSVYISPDSILVRAMGFDNHS